MVVLCGGAENSCVRILKSKKAYSANVDIVRMMETMDSRTRG